MAGKILILRFAGGRNQTNRSRSKTRSIENVFFIETTFHALNFNNVLMADLDPLTRYFRPKTSLMKYFLTFLAS